MRIPPSSFLSFVSNAQTFDQSLRNYIATTYTQQQSVGQAPANPTRPWGVHVANPPLV